MSADLLRRAASLMRERAEATAAPHHAYSDRRTPLITTTAEWSNECRNYLGGEMGDHCASWHPAVALAVADWLDGVALFIEAKEDEEYFDLDGDPIAAEDTHAIGSALTVAVAYLGEVGNA